MYGSPLLNIQKGERMYKWFIFRPAWGRAQSFEYRILTKETADGTLELVAYNFKLVNGQPRRATSCGPLPCPKSC